MEKLNSEIKPIDRAIPPQKAQQWHFKIHPYFTKQASNVVRAYIENFSKKGDTVLDPFCGTGVTAIESLTARRKTINVDIAPLAIFLTKQTCIAPVGINSFQKSFDRLRDRLRETVRFVRKVSDKRIQEHEIKEWYPKNVRLPSNSDFEFVEDLFDKRQLIVLAKLWKEIERIRDPKIRDLMKFVFSGTIARANLTYNLSTTRGEARLGDGGSSVFAQYRYWKPKRRVVLDVWDRFEYRFECVRKAKEASNELIGDFYKEGDTFRAYVESATKLSEFTKEKSIDYIYTDPPYGAHIAYLDLTTMWDAWLGFKIKEEDRKSEVIEGGDQKHSKEDYLNLLNQSIVEMYKVLKKDAWLSLVFQHKETWLWYTIRDAAKDAGFEYVNTVTQPTRTTSIHKKKNPLKVLGGQLIINFSKSRSLYSGMEPEALPAIKVILNAAEREIVRAGGATLEEIMQAVVPELFEAKLIDKFALKTAGDISELLTKEFEIGLDDRWHLKKENEKRIGHYLPTKDKIRYYLISFLRREKMADFDKIVSSIFPLLINAHQPPPKKDILGVLEEIAVSRNGRLWELRRPEEIIIQNELDLLEKRIAEIIPKGTLHNQLVYRLLVLAGNLGLIPYLGKKEQTGTKEKIFENLKFLNELPFKKIGGTVKKRVEQIDCIWFHKDGTPLFAFEVEESTGILSALERFHALLKVNDQIGFDRRLVIIAPKSRRKKLLQELTSSSYVGHPNFLEQKISYMFSETLIKYYPELIRKEKLEIENIDRLLTPAKVLLINNNFR
jgi:DNA modification methylase